MNRPPVQRLTRTPTVTTEADAEALIDHYLQQEAFAFDVESVGEHRGTGALAQVTWLSMATHGRVDVIPLGHPHGELVKRAYTRREKYFDPEVLTEVTKVPKTQYRSVSEPAQWTPAPPQLRHSQFWKIAEPLFMSEEIVTVCHNSLYDLAAVSKYLPSKPAPPYDDTMFMARLIDEGSRMGLKSMVEKGNKVSTSDPRHFPGYGHKYDHENVGRAVEKHPFGKVARYAALDAMYTWWLWQDLWPILELHKDVETIYLAEMDLYEYLLDMHLEGQPVNKEALYEISEVFTKDLHEAEKAVYAEAGKIFNLNSPVQMREVLFEDRDNEPVKMTDGGDPSTDKEVLSALEHKDPIAAKILHFREFNKMVSSYLGETMEDGDVEGGLGRFIIDGRIHTDLKPWGTVTGRFSSSDPNLQNIPRRGEHAHLMRKLFVAPPGYHLIVADYSQIEYRVLAHYSGDPTLIKAFEDGYDPHAAVASMLLGKAIDEVTPEERDLGKAQPVDEPVLTPDRGFVPMGSLVVGDFVVGSDGQPTEVRGVFPQGVRPTYRVTFSDGSSTRCDEEHLWSVSFRGRPKTVTVREMLARGLRDTRGMERLWEVPLLAAPVQHSHAALPVPPYLMGALLGDGSFRGGSVSFSSEDADVVARVRDEVETTFTGTSLVHLSGVDYSVTTGSVGVHPAPAQTLFREMGLWGEKSQTKFVPDGYLVASEHQRLDLLRGLMDTDGWVVSLGSGAGFSSASRPLAEAVVSLVQSLGGVATLREKATTHLPAFVVHVNMRQCPFWMSRKASSWKPQARALRRVESIERVADEMSQCIRVAAGDSLYVTRDYVLTHNTFNFAQIYGAGNENLANGLGVTINQIKAFRKKYDEDFPLVGKFSRYVVHKARKRQPTPYISTLGGRRRHLPALLWSDSELRSAAERQAVNSLIQGSAADIIKFAMLDVGDGLKDYPDWHMLLTVHDELMLMAPEEEAPDCAVFLQETMEAVEAIDVPLVAEAAHGSNWNEAK